MVKCSIIFCTNNRHNLTDDDVISFFRFPNERHRFDAWLYALGRPELGNINPALVHRSKYRVCSSHFDENAFSSSLSNRLKKEAVPSIFPKEAGDGPYFTDSWATIEETSAEDAASGERLSPPVVSEMEKNESDDNQENEGTDKTETEKSENGIEEKQTGSKEETTTEESTELAKEGKQTAANETENDNETQADDIDEEDDFNPLLLCPDISMDVDESPVLTTNFNNDLDKQQQQQETSSENDQNSLFTPLFSTFVDEMTGAEISFDLNPDEQQLREKLYGPNNPIERTRVHCTACNVHLGSALAGQTNRFVHPLLKVLICKKCYHFYTSGEFEKDEDGSELYCRWCGQGGKVICCTTCEFVFCRKCIRVNFGRKKLAIVTASDDWKCFRCDQSQLTLLRAMCFEFFEYVRKETARAAHLNDNSFMNCDLTNCCQSQQQKRRHSDIEQENNVALTNGEKLPKRKWKKNDEDPDYNPYANSESAADGEEQAVQEPISVPAVLNLVPTNTPKPIINRIILNKPIVNKAIINKPLPTLYPKPVMLPPSQANQQAQMANKMKKGLPTLTPSPHTARSSSAVRKNAVFAQAMNSFGTPSVPPQNSRTNNTNQAGQKQLMKHDWFDKTVRSAARVNSNLSFTLTQLNKSQAAANSVEQLAVVHNKLQEILSSSINSLIQIRKNLRTEFIAGIKTMKFPAKTQPPPRPPIPTTPVASDDDVILISDSKDSENEKTTAPPMNNSTEERKYLKVKSFSQLQTVSSECITIPDDDISETKEQNEPKDTPGPPPLSSINGTKKEEVHSFNLKDLPSPDMKRMLSVRVNLKKLKDVDQMVKEEKAVKTEQSGGDEAY